MRLAQEISRQRRVRSDLSILIFEVDQTKKIYEKFGSEIGDSVLNKMANLIKRLIGFNDIPCRYGGEKFAVILPDTDLEGAKTVAEKIRKSLNTQPLFNLKDVDITASLGVGLFSLNDSMEQYLSLVEKRLKTAREKGNLVIF